MPDVGSRVRQGGASAPVHLNGSAGRTARRTVGRRRSLPSGRALAGGLLVAASAVGMYSAYAGADGGPTESFVVASRALAPGTRLGPLDLAVRPADLPESVADRAFSDPDTLVGATLIAPLAAGELVQASAVVAKPSGPRSREMTFSVDRDALPPRLEHGETIDILATYGTGPDAVTVAVVRDVPLVALESGPGRLGDSSSVTLTVAVDGNEAPLALAHAIALARPAVVRSTGAPSLPPSAFYRQPAGPAVSSSATPIASAAP